MKYIPLKFLALSVLICTFDFQSFTFAQGTAFTYQGVLNNTSVPASGSYDLRFALYDALSGGNQMGGTVTNAAAEVSNGVFAVTVDFGNQFPGANRWLEIGVRSNATGSFTTLAPRQFVAATPYAIQSANAALATTANSVAASNVTGSLATTQLPASVLTNGATGVNLTGSFSGNAAGVTNVGLGNLASGGSIGWFGTFVQAYGFGTGTGPRCVAAADLNGDGRLDLVSADSQQNSVTVFSNSGAGFVYVATLGSATTPYFVTAADINGDNKPDLISANLNATSVTIWTNNGNGSFTFSSSPSAGPGALCVVATDVNGDNKMDLVTANGSALTLSVLTNNGTGTFSLASSPSIPNSYPVYVTAADVNGDGKADLITANAGSGSGNTLSVLTNNGSGGFVLASSPVVGIGPQAVAAVDLNGDGKVDLVSANNSTNTLTVLTNIGNATFSLSSTIIVGSSPHSVVGADVNGDGKIDLIAPNYAASTVNVLTNNGSGTFTLYSTADSGSLPDFITSADLNGDGRPDLVSCSYTESRVAVLINKPAFIGAVAGDGSALSDAAGWRRVGPDISYSLGRVGIGNLPNITPQAKLHLYDPLASITELIETGGGINAWSQIQFRTLGASWNIGTSHGYLSDAFYIDYTGNGIVEFSIQGNGAVYATSFNPSSDRNVKENFQPISAADVLSKVSDLPIQEWNFKNDPTIRHVGPMAQDFYSAFGLGSDEKHIATVDADGVALAAIQGLNEKVEDTNRKADDRIQKLEKENAEMRSRVERLEQLLEAARNSK